MRYFLGTVSIIGFCDFMIFSSCRNTLILQSCVFIIVKNSLIHGCKHNWPNLFKTLVHFYVDFSIFVFLN